MRMSPLIESQFSYHNKPGIACDISILKNSPFGDEMLICKLNLNKTIQ